jgi:integrase
MQKREMKVLSEAEAIRLLVAAQNSRHGALIHLALATGMRKRELLGLKWSDLDWNRSMLRISRQVQRVTKKGMIFGPPKTDAGRRTIPLDENTLRVIRKHLAQQRLDRASIGERWQDFGLMFPSTIGTPQSPSNLLKEFKVLLGEAGVRVIRFHDLRHTAASHMLNQGVPISDVSKILGHSEPSTTLDIYTHLIPVAQDGAASFSEESTIQLPVLRGEQVGIKISPNPQAGSRSKLIARQLHVNPEACW